MPGRQLHLGLRVIHLHSLTKLKHFPSLAQERKISLQGNGNVRLHRPVLSVGTIKYGCFCTCVVFLFVYLFSCNKAPQGTLQYLPISNTLDLCFSRHSNLDLKHMQVKRTRGTLSFEELLQPSITGYSLTSSNNLQLLCK